ncbi:hypothetical protein ACJ73_07292 [Blastomyces percursus]|uniref:Myb-like domain-containing protein n=1 Tax=Blastomyces percursus TaxID=1658174 RepID=A0A1J9PYH2_9EURO|nr:hypothetical protein ACJ73_07292 [Blastomyces percursus]
MAPDVQSDSPQARQISDKKWSKWSSEEDALIIELRQRGMAWGDISKELPGASRFKSEMWAKIAEEMSIPWRAVEAMHWQPGEQEMARRAGTVPFSFSQPASKRSSSVQLPPFAEMTIRVRNNELTRT